MARPPRALSPGVWSAAPSTVPGMECEIKVTALADGRSVLTNAASPDVLAEIAASWPRPAELPLGVEQLWNRALAQFRSGIFAYENFTDAVRTGFEAVDSALRHHASDLVANGKKVT